MGQQHRTWINLNWSMSELAVSRVESLLPDKRLSDRNRELISRFNSSGWFNSLLLGLRS